MNRRGRNGGLSAVAGTVISLTDLSRMLLENYAIAILINSFQ